MAEEKWVLKTLKDTYIAVVNGAYVETPFEEYAKVWPSAEKAAAALNCLPTALRPYFFTGRYGESIKALKEETTTLDSVEAKEPESKYTPVTIKYAEMPSFKAVQEYSSKVDDLVNLIQSLPDTQRSLKQEQDRLEGAICDIQHYMEFGDLSASDGFKAYKLMQSYLQQRRVIKDKFIALDAICQAVDVAGLGKAQKQINGLGTRIYSPREIPELFSDANLERFNRRQKKRAKQNEQNNRGEQ